MPGLLSALALMVMVWMIARRRNYAKDPRATFGQIWRAFQSAFLALLTPVILIGGIFGGVFTPTEAAAVAAFYALFLGVVVYRELSLADLVRTFREVTLTTAVVGLILSGATLFNWVLARENVPQLVAQTLISMSEDPTVILLLINVLLLVLGMFVDPLAIMILLVPVFTTITAQVGIDPVHFGVVMVFNLMIGLLTPPMGVGLFVVARVSGMPLETVVRGILPFLVALVAVLLLITLVPELVLALPHWAGLG
jgi:tripartite ATP-independent transporter DctM subunit